MEWASLDIMKSVVDTEQVITQAMVYADEHQCGQLQFQEGKEAYHFDCGEEPAGEVSVRLSSGQSLQVCELEVLGEK